MWRRVLRLLGVLVYAVGVLAVFTIAAYVAFSLFVRRGVTPVPDLASLNVGEAETRLADQGLRLIVDEGAERYDDEIPAGSLVSQRPRAGSLVKRGSAVSVVVSLGPAVVEVPDLTGVAVQAAQVSLTAAGLTLGRTASIYGQGSPRGRVVVQDPPPEVRINQAGAVDLFVCGEDLAETYVMPDLVYRDYDSVRRFFELHGFRLGSVKPEPYEGVAPGVVLRQFPLAGHPLRRHEVISLVVSASVEGA